MTAEDDDRRLTEWTARLTAALDRAGLPLGDLEVDTAAVLGLAGRAAHSVIRPAAPLTTFIVGYAAGLAAAGATPPAAAVASATRVALEQAELSRDDEPSDHDA